MAGDSLEKRLGIIFDVDTGNLVEGMSTAAKAVSGQGQAVAKLVDGWALLDKQYGVSAKAAKAAAAEQAAAAKARVEELARIQAAIDTSMSAQARAVSGAEGAWHSLAAELSGPVPNAFEKARMAQEAQQAAQVQAFLAMEKTEKVVNALKISSLNLAQAIGKANPDMQRTVAHIAAMADAGGDAIQSFMNLQKTSGTMQGAISAVGVGANIAALALEAINTAVERINDNKLTGIHAIDAGLREVLSLAYESKKAMLEIQFPAGHTSTINLLAQATKVLGVEVTDVAQAMEVLQQQQQLLAASSVDVVDKTDRVKEAIAKGWTEADKYKNVVGQNIAARKF